ncbi:hypothetical protein B0H14DRAFT_2624992 [Mycena olivaceomarginata]|nr:hypothetical protein B0H14DRAFT_2624992 [Mycena olivaceomarginata]
MDYELQGYKAGSSSICNTPTSPRSPATCSSASSKDPTEVLDLEVLEQLSARLVRTLANASTRQEKARTPPNSGGAESRLCTRGMLSRQRGCPESSTASQKCIPTSAFIPSPQGQEAGLSAVFHMAEALWDMHGQRQWGRVRHLRAHVYVLATDVRIAGNGRSGVDPSGWRGSDVEELKSQELRSLRTVWEWDCEVDYHVHLRVRKSDKDCRTVRSVSNAMKVAGDCRSLLRLRDRSEGRQCKGESTPCNEGGGRPRARENREAASFAQRKKPSIGEEGIRRSTSSAGSPIKSGGYRTG